MLFRLGLEIRTPVECLAVCAFGAFCGIARFGVVVFQKTANSAPKLRDLIKANLNKSESKRL